jgi:hypothetical protein
VNVNVDEAELRSVLSEAEADIRHLSGDECSPLGEWLERLGLSQVPANEALAAAGHLGFGRLAGHEEVHHADDPA